MLISKKYLFIFLLLMASKVAISESLSSADEIRSFLLKAQKVSEEIAFFATSKDGDSRYDYYQFPLADGKCILRRRDIYWKGRLNEQSILNETGQYLISNGVIGRDDGSPPNWNLASKINPDWLRIAKLSKSQKKWNGEPCCQVTLTLTINSIEKLAELVGCSVKYAQENEMRLRQNFPSKIIILIGENNYFIYGVRVFDSSGQANWSLQYSEVDFDAKITEDMFHIDGEKKAKKFSNSFEMKDVFSDPEEPFSARAIELVRATWRHLYRTFINFIDFMLQHGGVLAFITAILCMGTAIILKIAQKRNLNKRL